jgi:hypothetical protein
MLVEVSLVMLNITISVKGDDKQMIQPMFKIMNPMQVKF